MTRLPRAIESSRWALLTAAPAPIVLIGWWRGGPLQSSPIEAIVPAIFAVLLLATGGLLLPTRPKHAQVAAGLGLLSLLAVAAPALVRSPALALLLAAAVLIALVLLYRVTRAAPRTALPPPDAQRLHAFRGAGLAAVILWLFSTLAGTLKEGDLVGLSALALSAALAVAHLWRWAALAVFRHNRTRVVLIGAATVCVFPFIAAVGLHPETIADALASVTIVGLLLLARLDREHGSSMWDLVLGHPARLMVATFGILCVVGTILLALPRSSATGLGVPIEDAAFVSVSAVCVTGLSPIDVSTVLSPMGQFVLLLLIQAGGLGIMTFSTAAMRLLGGRVSLRHEGAMAQLVSPEDRSRIFASTYRLMAFTFAAEAIGAICLWFAFVGAGVDPGEAVWKAIFTAVSAFCNAGFALAPDSLVGFQQAPAVLHLVGLLIIVGGLSPAVVLAVPRWIRRRPVPIAARLAIITTLVLLFIGFIGYVSLEWSGPLGHLSTGDRIHNAWFQAISVRTAGFNSIDITNTSPTILLLTMALMLAGGSPGGTAGGIKTTTIAVIVLSILATMRGRTEVVAGGRRIGERTLYKAIAVVSVFLVTVFCAVIALLLTQDLAPSVSTFEAVSALGTVGLTINGTANLDEIGRGIIMACMFVGRVGPLTLLLFLSRERERQEAWKHPEMDIEVA
ncbi:MAG: hypothetical protein IT385_25065 [Deltaproteobacteria bacterium]|nr:hypothetical protein [Deltaproteobacteria bacterium]